MERGSMLPIRQNRINHVHSNAGKENLTEQVHQITKGGQHRSPAPIGLSLLGPHAHQTLPIEEIILQ